MYSGPNRKNQRLKEYDYSENGAYFVTICTKNRENYFGEIFDGKMILNEYGRIVDKEIIKTEEIRKEILIDEFVIMPNHLHLIIIIENVGNAGPRSLRLKQNINDFTKNYLSNVIQRIKSSSTLNIRKQFNDYNFSWQKSFYERIIRNEDELIKTKEYIINNPLQWEFDKNNPINF